MKRISKTNTPSIFLCFLLGLLSFIQEVPAQNLLLNGDFSLGNTGFQNDYLLAVADNTQGIYAVTGNPNAWNPLFLAQPTWYDHTPTSDNMSLIVDGATTPNMAFWRETVSVQKNTQYQFKGWASDLYPSITGNMSLLQAYCDGIALGSTLTLLEGCPNWQQFSTTFNSGNNTSITVSMQDLNLSVFPNDFAIDDLSLVPVPEPASLSLLAFGFVCLAFKRLTGRTR